MLSLVGLRGEGDVMAGVWAGRSFQEYGGTDVEGPSGMSLQAT